MCVFESCSTKKNTVVTRNYHNLNSRFNGYFNANESLNEATTTLAQNQKDDYDKILSVFQYGYDPKEFTPIIPNLDKTYKKASLVIERHSMLIKGTEYCKWIDETYMLIGRTHFYKHDYFQGLEVFEYVAGRYKKLPTKYEALLWQMRTYNELTTFSKTLEILEFLKNDKKFPKKLYEGEFSAICADFYLKQNDYDNAAEYLTKAYLLEKNKKTKIRYAFILGQLNQKLNNNEDALKYYEAVIKMNATYDMAFQAKINESRSFNPMSKEGRGVKKRLQKMAKDSKNSDFYDQLNYALAEIAEKEGDKKTMEKLLLKSIETSVKNNHQKGLSALKLGEHYFYTANYKPSQAYYDTAVANLKKDYDDYETVLERKIALTEAVKHILTVEREDSLQRIARMSEKEREKYVSKIIDDEVKAEKKRLEEAEFKAQQAANSAFTSTNNNASADNFASGSTWYFYNSAALTKGVVEFQRKWGQRKLEDNWRRSDKQAVMTAPDDTNSASDSTKTGGATADLSADEIEEKQLEQKKKDYLTNVPTTDALLDSSNKKIIESLYSLGFIYKEQLDIEQASVESFEKLLARYPDNKYQLPCYYQLYRLYKSLGDEDKANTYKNLILSKYPDSDYAEIIKNPNAISKKTSEKQKVDLLYEEAFEAYKSNNCTPCLSICNSANQLYPNNYLQAKFEYITALCTGKNGSIDEMERMLKAIAINYPKDDVMPLVNEALTQIKNNKQNIVPAVSDTTKKQTWDFNTSPDAEHYFIAAIPMDKLTKLKTAISDFNNTYFSTVTLNISDYEMNGKGLIVVKSYANKAKAKNYFEIIEQSDVFKQISAQQKNLFYISSDNFLILFKDKKLDNYIQFFEQEYSK